MVGKGTTYAHHLQLFSHVLPIGLQLKLYLYKLWTGGMQKQCTFTVHSEDCVSCLTMHGLMYRMFLDKLKKKGLCVFLSECEVCKDFDDVRHTFLLLYTRFPTFIHFSHDNLSQIHIN